MKIKSISFIIGIIFLILSYVVKDTLDLNFHDAYYVIEYSFLFKLLAFLAFFVSVILSFKNKNIHK
jgi:uncharacterized membrane protein YdbT with pleckstrin-like domain